MDKAYKPKKKEVLGEVLNGVKDKFTREKMKIREKLTKDYLSNFAQGFLVTCAIPYLLPRVVREFKEGPYDPNPRKNTSIKDRGFNDGVGLGLVGWIGQAVGYGTIVNKTHRPEILLIPFATNLTSGAYELGRKMYKKAESRLISRHQESSLETATQEPTKVA